MQFTLPSDMILKDINVQMCRNIVFAYIYFLDIWELSFSFENHLQLFKNIFT